MPSDRDDTNDHHEIEREDTVILEESVDPNEVSGPAISDPGPTETQRFAAEFREQVGLE